MMEQLIKNQTFQFRIGGMDCAGCAQSIENGVAKLEGVQLCEISFARELLNVSGTVSADSVTQRVEKLGFNIDLVEDETATPAATPAKPPRFWHFMWNRRETRLVIVATLLILPSLILHEFLPMLSVENIWLDGLAIIAIVLAGYPVAQSAWRALSINREININVLMTLAAIGALIIGEYVEAGVVIILFVLGEAIEGFTAEKARHSIRVLMELAPTEAIRFSDAGQESVPVSDLKIGDRILVKPGAQIPMDGTVLAGQSAVNQAPITGESRLVDKQVGSQLFASSVNGEGVLEVEVTHLAQDSTIVRLIKMVEEAQEKRSPTQRLVNRFAQYYTPVVLLFALLVAVIPPLFFDQPFWNASADETGWFYRALALLVIACPCALVISTPAAIVSAITHGAKHGILIKGGAILEELSHVRAIAFDKTGTLTAGEPQVVGVHTPQCTCVDSSVDFCQSCRNLFALAAAVEAQSEHPIARAVVEYGKKAGVERLVAQNVRAQVGRGIVGDVSETEIMIASHAHFHQHQLHHTLDCATIQTAEERGETAFLVSQDGEYLGFMVLVDQVRETSKHVVSQLRGLGLESVVMLTGDNQATAVKVAQDVGLTEFQANCLPEDKVVAVQALIDRHKTVAMVGDGINDTPALATASVGIAIGRAAQAMETADISLMGESLISLPYLILLARRAMNIIRLNLLFSIGIKIMFMGFVLAGIGTMWMAILADVGTTILVTLHAPLNLRLFSRNRG